MHSGWLVPADLALQLFTWWFVVLSAPRGATVLAAAAPAAYGLVTGSLLAATGLVAFAGSGAGALSPRPS